MYAQYVHVCITVCVRFSLCDLVTFFLLSSIAITIVITSGKGVHIDEDGLVIRVVQLHKSVVIPLR